MGLPRLVYAYVRLESAHSAIEIGQDQMILAPRNPTSLAAVSFPDLYGFGNLYLRAPQIRGEHTFATGDRGELLAVGRILAPIGGDFTASSYSFAPPALAGERSRRAAPPCKADSPGAPGPLPPTAGSKSGFPATIATSAMPTPRFQAGFRGRRATPRLISM